MENKEREPEKTLLENMESMLKACKGIGWKNINKNTLPEFETFVKQSGLTYKQVALMSLMVEEDDIYFSCLTEAFGCSAIDIFKDNLQWYCLDKLNLVGYYTGTRKFSMYVDILDALVEKGRFPRINTYSRISEIEAWVIEPMLRYEEGLIDDFDFTESLYLYMDENHLIPKGIENKELVAFLAVCRAYYGYRDSRDIATSDLLKIYTSEQLEGFKKEVEASAAMRTQVEVVCDEFMFVEGMVEPVEDPDGDDAEDEASTESETERKATLEEVEDDDFDDSDDDDNDPIGSPFSRLMKSHENTLCVKIKSDDIAEKQMFYNASEQEKVNDLKNLLDEDKYALVCERMDKMNMKKGFQVLMSGGPGTGKTETVMQLARMTGRDVIRVDISQIRDKYIGETERNIKKVFDDYRKAKIVSEKHPILLFNEADGVLGERMSKVDSGGERMENAMQNIILQEMEDFEGIMIATTNLIGTLDDAFERRFLYKMVFDKPNKEVREKLWTSKLEGLKAEDAHVLAEKYDLSGGQIDNVVRKHSINQVLYGFNDVTLCKIETLCDAESWAKKKKVQRLGFMSA